MQISDHTQQGSEPPVPWSGALDMEIVFGTWQSTEIEIAGHLMFLLLLCLLLYLPQYHNKGHSKSEWCWVVNKNSSLKHSDIATFQQHLVLYADSENRKFILCFIICLIICQLHSSHKFLSQTVKLYNQPYKTEEWLIKYYHVIRDRNL